MLIFAFTVGDPLDVERRRESTVRGAAWRLRVRVQPASYSILLPRRGKLPSILVLINENTFPVQQMKTTLMCDQEQKSRCYSTAIMNVFSCSVTWSYPSLLRGQSETFLIAVFWMEFSQTWNGACNDSVFVHKSMCVRNDNSIQCHQDVGRFTDKLCWVNYMNWSNLYRFTL